MTNAEPVYELIDHEPYVFGRHVPWRSAVIASDARGQLAFQVRAFHVLMENGLTLSTVWGSASYSDNYKVIGDFVEASYTAELAAWWKAGDLLEWPDGETVLAWFHAENWWQLVDTLAKLTTGSDLHNDADIASMIWSNAND